jgi:hypothetical protein
MRRSQLPRDMNKKRAALHPAGRPFSVLARQVAATPPSGRYSAAFKVEPGFGSRNMASSVSRFFIAAS